jgi:hypothetical protein
MPSRSRATDSVSELWTLLANEAPPHDEQGEVQALEVCRIGVGRFLGGVHREAQFPRRQLHEIGQPGVAVLMEVPCVALLTRLPGTNPAATVPITTA